MCFVIGFSVKQHLLNLPVGASVPLPCVSNYIIVMQQLQGSVNFTRNWVSYRNGFGDFAGPDFWIGNQNIYGITNNNGVEYTLRVEVSWS